MSVTVRKYDNGCLNFGKLLFKSNCISLHTNSPRVYTLDGPFTVLFHQEIYHIKEVLIPFCGILNRKSQQLALPVRTVCFLVSLLNRFPLILQNRYGNLNFPDYPSFKQCRWFCDTDHCSLQTADYTALFPPAKLSLPCPKWNICFTPLHLLAIAYIINWLHAGWS